MALALACFAIACIAAANGHPAPSVGWRVCWNAAAILFAVVGGLVALDVIHVA